MSRLYFAHNYRRVNWRSKQLQKLFCFTWLIKLSKALTFFFSKQNIFHPSLFNRILNFLFFPLFRLFYFILNACAQSQKNQIITGWKTYYFNTQYCFNLSFEKSNFEVRLSSELFILQQLSCTHLYCISQCDRPNVAAVTAAQLGQTDSNLVQQRKLRMNEVFR